MSQIAVFPQAANDGTDGTDARTQEYARAVQVMLSSLPLADRESVIRLLAESIRPQGPNSKAGDVLGTIIRLLPKNRNWTVEDLKKGVEDHGVTATDKQVFNAVGYLTRKGRIKRIGYGRYVVDGVAFVGPDNLGGQPSITEEDLDD